MIIDAFTVAGGYPVRPVKMGLDQLHATTKQNDVDMTLTMSLRAIQVDAVKGNELIFEAAECDPHILPVAVIDPRDRLRIEPLISRAVSRGAVALAFHMTAIPCPPSSILLRRALALAATTEKPLIFVSNTAGQLTQIAEMTRDLKCQKVALAGASYHLLPELLALLEEFDHIHVETSWQVGPGSVALLNNAGAGRVLFGSMAPLRPIRPALNMVAETDLSDAQKTDILARNTLRFLGREGEACEVSDGVSELKGMPTLPAIDVHCHIGVMPQQPSTCLGAAAVCRELERFNIELAIVSSTTAYKDDLDAGNHEMLDVIKSYNRLKGSVVANPHYLCDSKRWLDVAVADPRIAHVTIHPLSTYERYSAAGWMHLFAEIAKRKLAVFYNTAGQDIYRRSVSDTCQGHLFKVRGAAPDEVDMFLRANQSFPDMPIILGHGHGLEGLELAAICSNIYLELCSSYPEQNVYRRAVDTVGADRILFGTDLEMISPAFVLGSLWEAQLTDAEQQKILHENARKILKETR